jgi:alpha-glucosidase
MRRLRRLVDSYDGDRMLVGEIYILSTKAVARFYGAGDELHLAFNFPPLYAPWAADKRRARIDRVREEFDPVEAWPTWVLSNHDNPRHRTRYGTDERARAAILLLVGLQGTPFLYAGEELGLSDAVIPPERVVDPGGRDGCRAPIPWTVEPAHGWATTDPWLPWPPSPSTLNAATEVDEPGSMLSLYRTALAMRRTRPALSTGSFEWLESPTGVLAWTRREGRDRVAVAVNFGDGAVAVPAVAGTVLVASDPGVRADGWLPGSAAAWFGPED